MSTDARLVRPLMREAVAFDPAPVAPAFACFVLTVRFAFLAIVVIAHASSPDGTKGLARWTENPFLVLPRAQSPCGVPYAAHVSRRWTDRAS